MILYNNNVYNIIWHYYNITTRYSDHIAVYTDCSVLMRSMITMSSSHGRKCSALCWSDLQWRGDLTSARWIAHRHVIVVHPNIYHVATESGFHYVMALGRQLTEIYKPQKLEFRVTVMHSHELYTLFLNVLFFDGILNSFRHLAWNIRLITRAVWYHNRLQRYNIILHVLKLCI